MISIEVFNFPQSLDTYYDTDGVPVIVWSVREEERIYFHRQQTPPRQRDSRDAKPALGMPMTSLVLVEGVSDPRGLAVDWIGRNLYYIEGGSASVVVVNLDTRFKKVLELDLDDPQDVVVDPLSGKMFVSDYGANPKIYSADMDGGDQKVFVERKVLWPTSLAIGTDSILSYVFEN